jgi:hypothetical protein
MLVLCVLYNKDKRQKAGQSEPRSMDKVQRQNKRIKKKDVCCDCCVCCQVDVSATGRSLVERSLSRYSVSLCAI